MAFIPWTPPQFTGPFFFCSKPTLVQAKISGSLWPLSQMTGCHHKLSLAEEKLWVFPHHLLKYHRQHRYFVCQPEIRGTDFLSGHHTLGISNSSIDEQTIALCYISVPTQCNIYFHFTPYKPFCLSVCEAGSSILPGIIKQLILQKVMQENPVSDSEISKWLRKIFTKNFTNHTYNDHIIGVTETEPPYHCSSII